VFAPSSEQRGFQCDTIYTLGGQVTLERATEMHALGQRLGLTEFNPTSVNWDAPITWKGAGGVITRACVSRHASASRYLHCACACVRSLTRTVRLCLAGGGIMTEGEGYGLLVGFGMGLTCLTVLLTAIERKFSTEKASSELFNTAGRSIKTGLTGSVIVSQWTWAATLLQSSNVAWNYGITGPFWYAAGATIQILLFGILAIEVKRRAPNAHTFLEIIKVRWGTLAHLVFMFFGLSANLIVSAMLLLGGWCVRTHARASVTTLAPRLPLPARARDIRAAPLRAKMPAASTSSTRKRPVGAGFDSRARVSSAVFDAVAGISVYTSSFLIPLVKCSAPANPRPLPVPMSRMSRPLREDVCPLAHTVCLRTALPATAHAHLHAHGRPQGDLPRRLRAHGCHHADSHSFRHHRLYVLLLACHRHRHLVPQQHRRGTTLT
jgi:hypothetical protein